MGTNRIYEFIKVSLLQILLYRNHCLLCCTDPLICPPPSNSMSMVRSIIKPRCACAARAYGSLPVCLSVCVYDIFSTAAECKCLFSNYIMFSWILIRRFCKKCYVQKLWQKISALAPSALQRPRVRSDLLDGTAFEVLPPVVCTKEIRSTKKV